MNAKGIWSITLHEMRSHRRLVRTHVFILIALIICVLYYLVVARKHVQSASVSPLQGIISPRYIMSLLSGSFVVLFSIGVLVLVFDLLRRDETSRIQEVISSKPVRNLDFLTGRLVGVMLTMSIPMIGFLFAMVVYGVIAETFSLPIGQPVVFWSVVSFIVLDIIPNFAFFGSLAILISLISKSRLVAIFLSAFALGTLFWLNSRLPLDVAVPLQTVTGNVIFASELTPEFFTPTIVLNRITLVLLSIGFLCWASFLDKRLNPARLRELALGCTSFGLGVLVFGTVIGAHTFDLREVSRWIEVHNDHFIPSAFPDVQKIRGLVDIRPGRSLSIDLTLDVSVDGSQDSGFVLFSLNPGYKISQLTVGGEEVEDRAFQNGLLKIPSTYFSPGTNELKISAKGRPDGRFAYLDSRDAIAGVTGPEIQQLRLLGTESAIFHNKFVVLVPGIKWFPTSGTSTNEDSWERRKKDFFTLDIDVIVPKNWLVAGPAKRVKAKENSRTTFRFEQSDPITEIALVGSKFESASLEVEGIEFEAMYSYAHKSTFDAFAPAIDKIRERLRWVIEEIRDQGLNYGNKSYTLVEVPSTLRVFGGGVGLNTVMCPPGMLMMRESTLPTYPNMSKFSRVPSDQSDMTEEDWITSQLAEVIGYVQSSMFESNVNYVLYRNLLTQHTNATQQGARALNTLLGLLSEALFPARHSDFDFQIALNRNILDLVSLDPVRFLGTSMQWSVFSQDLERLKKSQAVRSAPEVWDTVASLSLHEPETQASNTLELRALRLRAQHFVELLRDSVGTDALAPISVALTNSFRGKNFLFEDFVDVLSDNGIDLEKIAGDLISKAELPGFSATDPNIQAVTGSDRTSYESSFVLRNDQPVSGPVQLSVAYRSDDPFLVGPSNSVSLPPFLVAANQNVRVVIESPNPVQSIWVKPYLSLNRKKFRIDLPLSDEMQNQEVNIEDAPVIKAIEIVEVEQLPNASITIDDLDPEFSVIEHRDTSVLSSSFTQFFRRLLGTERVQLDGGLPAYQYNFREKPLEWSRKEDPSAFGMYRRTFVLTTNNSERTASVKFSAKLPSGGRWKLEYYLPDRFLLEEIPIGGMLSVSLLISLSVSKIDLEILDGATTVFHSIEASNLSKGWHTVGNFDLSNTEVDVLVSNKTEHRYQSVFADAIRWTPIERVD
ncbi:MAG: hypothetical protein F4077_08900 [Gammaproteobacteria bacterium]|nr:hypothetical protein [Gammaproteobacteria bacterium]MYI77854.1 hypothetical protein [Gammaproteobacteria bacterium]